MDKADGHAPGPILPARGMLAPRWLFFFEKWYFDGQTDDGSFFLAYLAPLTLAGRRGAELVVCLFSAGSDPLRSSVHLGAGEVQLADDRTHAIFPGGELLLQPDRCTLHVQRGQTVLQVSYAPLDPPWAPLQDGVLLRRGRRSLRWVVPVPRARVSGRVSLEGREQRFAGYGYVDFVQTDIPPWRLPLRDLLWGRALSGSMLLVWNRARFRDGGRPTGQPGSVDLALCRLGEDPPRVLQGTAAELGCLQDHAKTGDRYPAELVLTLGRRPDRDCPDAGEHGPLVARLDRTRLLLGERVADVQRFGSGLERWLYRTVTGDPVEYKLLSRLAIGGEEALAAHEWVRWGRGRAPTS